MDCNLPGSSVHGILQARIPEWVAIPLSLQPRDWTQVAYIEGEWILYQLSHQESPRILEWVAYSFSRGSSRSKNWTGVSCISGRFFIKAIWFDVFSHSFPHLFVLLVFWIYAFVIPFFSFLLIGILIACISDCLKLPHSLSILFFVCLFVLVHTHSFIVDSFDCNVFEFINHFLLQCVFSHNTMCFPLRHCLFISRSLVCAHF